MSLLLPRKKKIDDTISLTQPKSIATISLSAPKTVATFNNNPRQSVPLVATTNKKLFDKPYTETIRWHDPVSKGGINVMRDIADYVGSGFQQGFGKVADVAVKGGNTLSDFSIRNNPFLSEEQKTQQLAQQYSNTEAIRNRIKSVTDLSGSKIAGTSDDISLQDIKTGDARKIAKLAGESLDTGLTATQFINPTQAAIKPVVSSFRSVVKPILKEAGTFGAGDAIAAGAQTYGETGDVKQSLKSAGMTGVTSFAMQGGMLAAGHGTGTSRATADSPTSSLSKTVADTDNVIRDARLFIDEGLDIPADIQARLNDEGITAVNQKDNPYGAEYDPTTRSINVRDQAAATTDNIFHELGHDTFINRLTPEERAVFADSRGAGYNQAKGRKGYTAEDLVSEDFSNMYVKALKGEINSIPKKYRATIAKYAKVALQEAEQARPGGARELVQAAKLIKSDLKPRVEAKTATVAPTPEMTRQITPDNALTDQQLLEARQLLNRPKVESREAPNIVKQGDELPLDEQLEGLILGNRSPEYNVSRLGKLAETLSPNRQIRKLTQPLNKAEDSLVRSSLESGTRLGRLPGRTAVGFSRQAGRKGEELSRYSRLEGEKQFGDELAKSVTESGDLAVSNGIRKDAVAAALDPELARAQGKEIPQLTPEEAVEVQRLRDIIDLTHEGQYSIGRLNEEAYQANKGKYFPRDFTEFFNDSTTSQIAKDNKLELNIFKNRKDLSDIPQEVIDAAQNDPYYLTALRVQQYAKNKAVTNYTNWLAKNGSVSDVPIKGYVKVPESRAYGDISGKYVLKEQLEDVQGFIYETKTAQNIVSLLNAFDRNPIRRTLKKTKTVYNPGVRVGNRTFNYLTSSLNGVNPITFTRNYARGRKMIKSRSPEYIEATKEGIFGSSIIDKELYRTKDALKPEGNIIKRGDNKASETYGAVDDEGKMAMYLTFRERGLNSAEAAERTRRAMQNYDLVGNLFDLGSKTPIGGNAFVRFSSELMRIAHNTAVDNPLRLVGAIAAVVAITELASRASGETPEDRETREKRLGAPRVPFTDQSLEVQTPWGAINVGRLLGITTYNDLNGGFGEDAKRLLPFQSPITNGDDGAKFNTNFVTADPAVGPIVQQLIDTDFRGKPISDPERDRYPNQPLSEQEQNSNRLKSAAMSYLPLSNEVTSLYGAATGGKDFYGRERSLPQATLRTLGVKVEQYGPEQAAEQRGKDEYFSGEYKRAQDWLKNNPDLAQAYNKFKGREKDRNTGKRYFDIVTPEKWSLVSSDSSGRLYDFLRQEAINKNKQDGTPVDPVYKLPTEPQQKLVLELRSRPTGEDIETEEILRATQPWYSEFEKAEKKYYDKSSKYFSGLGLPDTRGDRAKAYANIKYPEQSELVSQYYRIKNSSPEQAGQFYKNNADALAKDFTKYKEQRLKYINAKRKVEGYSPISWSVFNNITFGYEDDERKSYNQLRYSAGAGSSSGGYSRRSGGSGSSNRVLNPRQYAIDINAGGQFAKPTVKAPAKSKVAGKYTARQKKALPKVTIKKSKV